MTPPGGAAAAVRDWARMVKLSHTVFALPFALSGAALACATHGITWRQVLLVLLAMASARNAAMGFNRLADHALDAANPRTKDRELPRGSLSRRAVWTFTLALAGLFVAVAFALNPLCGALSPLALAIVFGYSYTKRFTWGSHLVLGLSLAIAPVGGWLAVAGRFALLPWLLALAVLLWVAGFDTIYACQDAAHDRAAGLHSIPARFGVPGALRFARAAHAASLAAMAAVGLVGALHPVYWLGVAAIAAVLVWEHAQVAPADLSRLPAAFLNANAVVSVVYFATVLASVLLGRAG